MKISESALFKRIRRRLGQDGQSFHTLRGDRWFSDLGRYYISDDRNNIAATHVDPQKLGLELGVIKDEDIVVRPELPIA